MAGAGYKLFNTGDVLLASEVNTYLMQQTVMSFADSAARTTALSGVLAEGMVSYLRDTNVVEIYNGSAWASLDDPNAIQNTIVDAKGDLITATGSDVPARLAVGANNLILSADSATATGLAWQGASTTYTTTWTASTTNPTIGNGTLTARYVRAGNLCLVSISLNFGSTSTAGSGTYFFSLPFTAKSSGNFGLGGSFYMEDSGVAGYIYFPFGSSTTTISLRSSTNNSMGHNNPFTWTNGDFLSGSFIYEVA
jgi:hypothetical protein